MAAAAAAAIVLAVALLGVLVVARLDRQLGRTMDRGLRARAVDVARLSASTPKLLTTPGALEGRLAGSTLYVQVLDRHGRLVSRSDALGSRVLPQSPTVRRALVGRQAAYGDAELGTDPVRIYAAPLSAVGGGPAAGGAVVVAGTTTENADTLGATRRIVVIGGLAAAILAAGLATLLAGRALAPLRRLSAGARDIERTGDAARRLTTPDVADEVGDLARTLNAMLASLERAREAERRFVGDASHELRTPMTSLRGNAAYVARHGAEPGAMADIERDVARLSVLLDDLLALAREDAAAPAAGAPVDLVAVARTAAAADAEDRATVVVADGDGDRAILVAADAQALERAAINLVHNARRHGPPGGAIAVEVGAARGRVWLTVADEGSGLAPGEAAHAFDRFWRGPGAAGEGSGLGLAIVRAIAERHGGHVAVDGARFTIDLPLLDAPPRRAAPASHGSLKDRP
ncbi:MAG TPA: HAMP domain-containing sensor histidine kinase [Baekduia sp.]|uniref:sensor histidine kinase n=1 Tax=Baekduia sp. TaxID=2600305 RepID=UPI002CE95D44|nr:HAMP domain-containing sensor histidine kinase [Baekduia sp.]HMJ34455.1 HAMP domain-containing sensor histidine kinase [Baekduia sp.]